VLIVLVAFRLNAGVSLIVVAFLGCCLLTSPGLALTELGGGVIWAVRNYDLSVIPLLVLMCGIFWREQSSESGALFGGLRVEPAMTRVVVRSDSAMTRVVVRSDSEMTHDGVRGEPEMTRGGFRQVFIFPVLALVIIAYFSGGSVGRFLMAGVFPGVITASLLMFAYTVANKEKGTGWRTYVTGLVRENRRGLLFPIVLIILICGIFFGAFTPTEAAAVGAFISLVLAAVFRKLTLKGFFELLLRSAAATAKLFVLIIGGSLFWTFMSKSLVHITFIQFTEQLEIAPVLIVGAFLIVYAIVGLILDFKSALVLATPIAYPIVVGMGYSGTWFGVLSIMALMFGLLSGPLEITLTFSAAEARAQSRRRALRLLPLWTPLLISCMITVLLPGVIMLLPRIMLGS